MPWSSSQTRKLNVGEASVLSRVGLNFRLSSDNVLDNEQLHVDFKPLYQCIHIYTALDAVEELQKSYQADRKVGGLEARWEQRLTGRLSRLKRRSYCRIACPRQLHLETSLQPSYP